MPPPHNMASLTVDSRGHKAHCANYNVRFSVSFGGPAHAQAYERVWVLQGVSAGPGIGVGRCCQPRVRQHLVVSGLYLEKCERLFLVGRQDRGAFW